MGWDGAGLTGPTCPGAAEAAAGFLSAAPAAAPGDFLEAVIPGTVVCPTCLVADALPEGVAESQGLLGMVPLKPEGDFLTTILAVFGRRLRGAVCMPVAEPGPAIFLEAAAATFSSALRSSFTAGTEEEATSGGSYHVTTRTQEA